MSMCVRCRGKDPKKHCGKEYCPLMSSVNASKERIGGMKKDFFGKSPNVFVGRQGYPDVRAGIIGGEQVNDDHDNPLKWARDNYDIERVLGLRTSMINSTFKANVKSFSQKLVGLSREVSMASKPVEMEVNLARKPIPNINLSSWTPPSGPSVELRKASITQNPRVEKKIEKAVDDTDYKSADAIADLYKKKVDENQLTKLISVGNLGVKTQRKMVPTRWSITAVDDVLGKKFISDVRQMPLAENSIYYGSHLGNHYLIVLLDDVWSYELFEMYLPKTVWHNQELEVMTDHEVYNGRKEYAEETAGGYYAARLAVAEKLSLMRVQSSVLALRFITDEYYAPLGVWVVRSAARKAMSSKPKVFGSRQEVVGYARLFARENFGFDIDGVLKKSVLLDSIKKQKKLNTYF